MSGITYETNDYWGASLGQSATGWTLLGSKPPRPDTSHRLTPADVGVNAQKE